jgi:hypothetical protein
LSLVACGSDHPASDEVVAAADGAASAALTGPGTGSTATVLAVNGRITPAVAGVIVVEYDALGQEVQRSTRTDVTGAFGFANPLSGNSLRTLARDDGLRVPLTRSALVRSGAKQVELTPLTTLYEQFASPQRSARQLREQLVAAIRGACGTDAADEASKALTAERQLEGDSREWLLRALAAHVRALNNVGYGTGLGAASWAEVWFQQQPLLAQMCDVASTVYSDAWLSKAQADVQAQLQALASVDTGPLADLRGYALDQALAGGSTAAAVQAYPQLGLVLQDRLQAWQGAAPALALNLAETAFLASVPADKRATAFVPPPAQVSYVLEAGGSVAQALSGRAVPLSSSQPTVRVSNAGATDRAVKLSINGMPLFDRDSLIDQILALPVLQRDEPLHRRAWRFVAQWRRHQWPLTAGRFQHQADLYLRSVGLGLCDDHSSALREIWAAMGFEARIWGLNGHVVPEVKVDGRWELYDPDYAVYYFNRQGQVSGVEELAQDPTLMTNPTDPVLPTWDDAYSPFLASLYSSAEDNNIEDWYLAPAAAPLANTFAVPAGGYLEVVGSNAYTMPSSMSPETKLDFAQVRVWFPPGWSGSFDLPLVLADITGSGAVRLLDRGIQVTAAGIRQTLLDYYATDPDAGVTRLTIGRVGSEGLTATLLVNAQYLKSGGPLAVTASGSDLSGIAIGPPPNSGTAR